MKRFITIAVIILLLVGASLAYWYFMMGPSQPAAKPTTTPGQGFQPLNPNGSGSSSGGGNGTTLSPGGNTTPSSTTGKLPVLRLLSASPVGGYSASSTAATTTIVWVDRGRGNVYQASDADAQITTLSNTVVPKIFNAIWNKNLTAFVGSLYEDGDLVPTNVYAELQKQRGVTASTTSMNPSLTPYVLQGKDISGTVIGYAASPDKTRLFIMMNENGNGVGYISAFNGAGMTQIFSTPVTQVSVSWPSDNIISIVTKGSKIYNGFLYFVSPKTGVWTRVLGPIMGLSAVVSHDGKNVLYSATDGDDSIRTALYSVAAATSTDALIRTVADKCAWGRLYTDIVYCGVPSDLPSGAYPDDWYYGNTAFSDRMWQLNAKTGEIKQISSITDQSDRIIDTYRPDTDPKDRYLLFMNKADLSFWSLDLTRTASNR